MVLPAPRFPTAAAAAAPDEDRLATLIVPHRALASSRASGPALQRSSPPRSAPKPRGRLCIHLAVFTLMREAVAQPQIQQGSTGPNPAQGETQQGAGGAASSTSLQASAAGPGAPQQAGVAGPVDGCVARMNSSPEALAVMTRPRFLGCITNLTVAERKEKRKTAPCYCAISPEMFGWGRNAGCLGAVQAWADEWRCTEDGRVLLPGESNSPPTATPAVTVWTRAPTPAPTSALPETAVIGEATKRWGAPRVKSAGLDSLWQLAAAAVPVIAAATGLVV